MLQGSLAELDRLASHPLAQGVSALTNAETWSLDEPQFEDVWSNAAQHRLALVLHPAFDCRPAKFTDWTIGGSLHAVMSSSLGVARLVMSGMLDRVPALDVIVPHLGGTIPYLAQRFVDMGRGDAEHDLAHYLRHRLYLDTCSYHPPAFRCALDTVGADRLVLGTDYPFRGSLRRAVDDVVENAPTAEARAAHPRRHRVAVVPLAEAAEERAHVVDEQLGLLGRGEVPTTRQWRPSRDVRMAFGDRPGYLKDVSAKQRKRRGRRDRRAGGRGVVATALRSSRSRIACWSRSSA